MTDEKQTEMASKIQKVVDEFRGTVEWEKSRNAFHTIMRKFVHGENSTISDEELDQHFERALTITQKDFDDYLNWTKSVPEGEKDLSSSYYLVTVTHDRTDQFFAEDQALPITGTGNKTLKAKFQAKNLYQRFSINATSPMPGKLQNSKSPLPDWNSIVGAMTEKLKFDQTFDLTNNDQRNYIYGIVSQRDWNSLQGDLFITPKLASGDFSPALYAIYFFGPDQSDLKDIFLVVTADGGGNPQKPFIGMNNYGPAKQHVFDSVNRFAFTYLSNADNPVKYWMMVNNDDTQGFTLGIQTFFPNHLNTPYIEVISEFTPASKQDVDHFLNTPLLVTYFMLRKGFLMRDLIYKYYPNSTEKQLWTDVGALTGNDAYTKSIIEAVETWGLWVLEKVLTPDWDQNPTISETSNTQPPAAPTNLVIK